MSREIEIRISTTEDDGATYGRTAFCTVEQAKEIFARLMRGLEVWELDRKRKQREAVNVA